MHRSRIKRRCVSLSYSHIVLIGMLIVLLAVIAFAKHVVCRRSDRRYILCVQTDQEDALDAFLAELLPRYTRRFRQLYTRDDGDKSEHRYLVELSSDSVPLELVDAIVAQYTCRKVTLSFVHHASTAMDCPTEDL